MVLSKKYYLFICHYLIIMFGKRFHFSQNKEQNNLLKKEEKTILTFNFQCNYTISLIL